jgi:hypothetical protein
MVPAEYLVNHGRAAFLGRFVNRAGARFAHSDRVMVRSSRGLETGTVLGEASPAFAHLVGPDNSGELLRPMSGDDERREAELLAFAERVRDDAQAMADASMLPVALLDAEILFEGDRAVLHALPLGECDLTTIAEALSERHALQCLILNLHRSKEPEEARPHGCGKPGCGTSSGGCSSCGTGGGCSTGSCSSGKVKSAEELTQYFLGLRRQLESQIGRVPLNE